MQDIKDCRVLVTTTSFARHDPSMRAELEAAVGEVVNSPYPRPLTSAELHEILQDVDGVIAGLDVFDAHALDGGNRLKVISRYGVGVDRIDLAAARERGVIVTNTPGVNAGAVAELTVGLLLSLARSLPLADSTTHAGEWRRLQGISIEGHTVGLIGFGAIGKQVARRLANFDCTILAYDPYPDAAFAAQYGVRLRPLDDVVAAADYLSLHLPALPSTRGLVNADFLARMKRGAYLINTARGELVDEAALMAALTSGQLGGAALDVFSVEPPGADHPLLKLPNVIVTPHIASATDIAGNAMGWAALRDCLAVLRGEAPKYPVG